MRARCLVLALFLLSSIPTCLADGPGWRRDVWWPQPGGQQLYAAGIWLDAQDRVHVAVGETTAGVVSHAVFDASFDFLYMNPVVGGLCDDNSVAGDAATGDVALYRTDELSAVLLDAAGEERWRSRAFGGSGLVTRRDAGGAAIQPGGDVVVAGGDANGTLHAARLARGGGGVVWSVSHAGLGTGAASGGIAMEPSGSVIVAGLGGGGVVLTRLHGGNGSVAASAQVPASGCAGLATIQAVDAVATDGSGNVYVAGHGEGGASGQDGFVMKLSPALAPLWCRRQSDGTAAAESWRSIAVDASGRVAVTGSRTATLEATLTALLDASGGTLWMKAYTLPSVPHRGNGVAFDGSGNVVVGGGHPGG